MIVSVRLRTALDICGVKSADSPAEQIAGCCSEIAFGAVVTDYSTEKETNPSLRRALPRKFSGCQLSGWEPHCNWSD